MFRVKKREKDNVGIINKKIQKISIRNVATVKFIKEFCVHPVKYYM